MRSQDEFVAARSADWRELEVLVMSGEPLHTRAGADISRAAALYRSLCTDLMRCRSSRYTADLTAYLDSLAGRAHNTLYAADVFRLPAVARFFAIDFPVTLRKQWRFFAAAWALLLIPWIIGAVGALYSSAFSEAVLPSQVLDQMARAYADSFDKGRDAGADAHMAGFYVYNNIGIAFRCFATGVLFGLGSIFFLIYNGLTIGTVLGYVVAEGYGRNILTFICGHAPFEITAIAVAGAAGLQMGYSLVNTGGRTRLGSLRAQAPEIATLVLGAASMLAIAAAIEGFWSPSSAPDPLKWTVAAVNAILVALYLALAGRRRARP